MSIGTSTTNLQSFLSRATVQAATDLATALERLPEDKRSWSAMGGARSALDQAAEVAILNGSTCNLLQEGKWPENYDFNDFTNRKAQLVEQGWSVIKPMLEENTKEASEVIASLPDEKLGNEVSMPWGPMTIAQIASYPYWNACYHEGQINYIASMIGCLE